MGTTCGHSTVKQIFCLQSGKKAPDSYSGAKSPNQQLHFGRWHPWGDSEIHLGCNEALEG